jgi:hypothetical protein
MLQGRRQLFHESEPVEPLPRSCETQLQGDKSMVFVWKLGDSGVRNAAVPDAGNDCEICGAYIHLPSRSQHILLFARSFGQRFGVKAAPFGSAFRTRVPRPSGFGLLPPRKLRVPFQKLLLLATR